MENIRNSTTLESKFIINVELTESMFLSSSVTFLLKNFQKIFEILDKINRYRTNILHTGGISITRFLGRDIAPNEIYVTLSEQALALAVFLRCSQNLPVNSQKSERSHWKLSCIRTGRFNVPF